MILSFSMDLITERGDLMKMFMSNLVGEGDPAEDNKSSTVWSIVFMASSIIAAILIM